MSTRRRRAGSVAAVVAGGLLFAGALAAQERSPSTLAGHVVDADGRPVAGATVAVHRVSDAGGAEIARTTTDGRGRFAVAVETEEAGIYFGATSHEGGLYFGALFRDPRDVPEDYLITVGLNPAAAAGPALPPPAPPPPNPWPVAVLLGLLGAGAVALPLASRGRRPYAVRALLHELAELEERQSADASAAPEYAAERAALRARILEMTRTAP